MAKPIDENIIDQLQEILIDIIYKHLKASGVDKVVPDFNKQHAKNMLGKIGTRIMFGSDVVDTAIGLTKLKKTK